MKEVTYGCDNSSIHIKQDYFAILYLFYSGIPDWNNMLSEKTCEKTIEILRHNYGCMRRNRRNIYKLHQYFKCAIFQRGNDVSGIFQLQLIMLFLFNRNSFRRGHDDYNIYNLWAIWRIPWRAGLLYI